MFRLIRPMMLSAKPIIPIVAEKIEQKENMYKVLFKVLFKVSFYKRNNSAKKNINIIERALFFSFLKKSFLKALALVI